MNPILNFLLNFLGFLPMRTQGTSLHKVDLLKKNKERKMSKRIIVAIIFLSSSLITVLTTIRSAGSETRFSSGMQSTGHLCFGRQDSTCDQGLNDNELPTGMSLIDDAIADPKIDFVATYYNGRYLVFAERGSMAFRRIKTPSGLLYVVDSIQGANPLGRQEFFALNDINKEFSYGDNPNDYVPEFSQFSGPDDPRLRFKEPEQVAYPLAYERIAALFDHQNSPDLIFSFRPYSAYETDGGHHGGLNVIESRAHITFYGVGVRGPQTLDGLARVVDVAPTIAKAMAITKRIGINESFQISNQNYLAFQDGHVLAEALTGNIPRHVILALTDGINNNFLMYLVDKYPESYPTLYKIIHEGATYANGMVSNFPSNTWPTHHSLVCGTWSGHHGIIDNEYFDRIENQPRNMHTDAFGTEAFFDQPKVVETIYEAIHRTYGDWSPENPEGAFCASMGEFATRGADFADSEGRDETGEILGCDLSPAPNLPIPQGACSKDIADQMWMETTELNRFWHLVNDGNNPIPAFTYFHWHSTDTSGHEFGPNSGCVANALAFHDRMMRFVLDTMEDADAMDQTMIVHVSDHGMQLLDATRSGESVSMDWLAKYRYRGGLPTSTMIYLACMDVTSSTTLDGDQPILTVAVLDDDNKQPISEADVTVSTDLGEYYQTVTDETGIADIFLSPGTIFFDIQVDHPDFNQVILEGLSVD